jgi:hypothetical protein
LDCFIIFFFLEECSLLFLLHTECHIQKKLALKLFWALSHTLIDELKKCGCSGTGRRRENQKWSKRLDRCIPFIATSEKDAYTILRASNPVHEPARPSRTVLTFSADHHFVAHFVLFNEAF